MASTSAAVREHLLPQYKDGQGYTVNQQLPNSDINPEEGQLVDDVASNQFSSSCSQSFLGSKIPGWPDRPLPLIHTRTARFISVALDSVLLALALLFLALAAGALAVSGRDIGDHSGELIEEAKRRAPTIFPIVFSALVGRALKTIGRFRSEKGIKVSVCGKNQCYTSWANNMSADANEVAYIDAVGVPIHQNSVRRISPPVVSRGLLTSYNTHGTALGNVTSGRSGVVEYIGSNEPDRSQPYHHKIYGHGAPRALEYICRICGRLRHDET